MISIILIEDFMKVNFQSIFQQNKTFVPNKADHGLSSVITIRSIRVIRVQKE